jgi:hypothetical protein
MKFQSDATVVSVHGAWVDGSSWNGIILPLEQAGLNVVAAPIPLTSLSDDVAALNRALGRMIKPKTQRFMAERMKATVKSLAADHSPISTDPESGVEFILAAASSCLV